jgi:hypothetical protein
MSKKFTNSPKQGNNITHLIHTILRLIKIYIILSFIKRVVFLKYNEIKITDKAPNRPDTNLIAQTAEKRVAQAKPSEAN